MIRKADISDLPALTSLAQKLWPEHGTEDLESGLRSILEKSAGAFFLAQENAAAVGFAQCQLRHDYVEGTQSSPVGYLEGIFVEPAFRGKGLAKQLLCACEAWAAEQGCGEFASDCELTNVESLKFHLCMGFSEANRIICFTKKL